MEMFLFHAVIWPRTSADGDLNRFSVNHLGDSHKDFPLCFTPTYSPQRIGIPEHRILLLCFDFCVVDF